MPAKNFQGYVRHLCLHSHNFFSAHKYWKWKFCKKSSYFYEKKIITNYSKNVCHHVQKQMFYVKSETFSENKDFLILWCVATEHFWTFFCCFFISNFYFCPTRDTQFRKNSQIFFKKMAVTKTDSFVFHFTP